VARLLGLLLLLGLGWLIVRQLVRLPPRRQESSPPRFEKTVQCARCGVHLPLSLAQRDHEDRPICGDPNCDQRNRDRDQSRDQRRDAERDRAR
jgi:hypothetical protein